MKQSFFHVFVLLMATVTISLSGCVSDKINSEEYKSPGDLAKERQAEIMECFINKDAETIKSFFSEYVIETYPDIDTQIDKAFNFLDGEIVSYDEPFSSASGSKDRKAYGADTRNIITDKGTEYKISFKGWLTNSKETNKIGVICIKVIDMTDEYDYSKNEKENGILYIGEPD
ncbi:DUF5104 domain-containing protein [Ruminococcus sp. Marseille-P6503]|uniref:DUF5104 domain-containing protein n=1 Tax=Ruminococcus sp. Marseille-P6503 TaxID=2364796 RepID=UPI000F534E2C|nr:DUF5104 domain-containing protein [Ruminococcus sp. Marseille-P6503]